MNDVTVIGGGPAGSSTAIRLARQGLRVRLFEKSHFPRAKLCGGFLSAEALSDLEELGILESVRSKAYPVHRTIVSSPSGAAAEAPLPSTGFSISRDAFDALLLDQARQAGVEVHEGVDGFGQSFKGWTIIAAGRGVKKGKAFYGTQAFFDGVEGITDQVELDLVPGGYMGLVRQGGRTNICALANPDIFQDHGPDLDRLLKRCADANPLLKSRIKNGKRVSSWKSVGPVVMGVRRLAEPGRLYVGDAACVVDPFVGEGMAMAIQSSGVLQKAFQQSTYPIEKYYEAAWRQKFTRALRVDGVLRFLMSHRASQEVIVHALQAFPLYLTRLTKLTRPAPVMPL